MNDIGKRIRQRRKDLHMSVDELAKSLGKNRATVYRYEKGDIEHLPIDILEPLAIVLSTTPQYLMGWVSEEPLAATNDEVKRQTEQWYSEFGYWVFTEEEFYKLVEYARFLISQRKGGDV